MSLPENKRIYLILLTIFLITRIFFVVIGQKLREENRYIRYYDVAEEEKVYGKVGTILHGWDSEWYLQIAQHGYPRTQITPEVKTPFVFFPLYPLVVGLLGRIIQNYALSGWLVSNLFFLASVLLIYKLGTLKVNKNIGFLAAVFLMIFPMNYIFSGIQSEALYLFLLLMVFYLLEKKEYFYAAIGGVLMVLTKHVGILIFFPILYFCLKNLWQQGKVGKVKTLIYSGLPFVALIGYSLFLYILTGDMAAFIHSEEAWQRTITLDFIRPFLFLFNPTVNSFLIRVNFLVGLILTLLAFFEAKRLGFAYLFIVISYFAIFLITARTDWHTFSISRYCQIFFPAYFYLARLSMHSKIFMFSSIFGFLVYGLAFFYLWTIGIPVPM